MSGFFISFLNMSLMASYVALIVIVVRYVLGKARVPKIFSYALWAVVWVRLIVPISFESAFSLIPGKTNVIPRGIGFSQHPAIGTSMGTVDQPMNDSIPTILPPADMTASVNPVQVLMEISASIWLLGAVVLISYALVSYVRLKRRLTYATRIEGNTYESDRIKTPFVMGFIKPRVYLPMGLAGRDKDYILKHETVHIRRYDHLIKPLAFVVLAWHWFNPLVWISYFLMIKDMEMSCDEKVIKETHDDIRTDYSKTLLALASKQSGLIGLLSFGQSSVKSRVRNILHYKRLTFWAGVVMIVVLAALTIGLIANPSVKSDISGNLTDTEAKNILKILIPQALDIAEDMFNGGDGNKVDKTKTIPGEPDYCLVTGEIANYDVQSVADIKKAVEDVFTKDVAQTLFFSKYLTPQEDRPLYKDYEGRLYVDTNNGGHGFSTKFLMDTAKIRSQKDHVVTIALDATVLDNPYGILLVKIAQINGKWMMASGLYDYESIINGTISPEKQVAFIPDGIKVHALDTSYFDEVNATYKNAPALVDTQPYMVVMETSYQKLTFVYKLASPLLDIPQMLSVAGYGPINDSALTNRIFGKTENDVYGRASDHTLLTWSVEHGIDDDLTVVYAYSSDGSLPHIQAEPKVKVVFDPSLINKVVNVYKDTVPDFSIPIGTPPTKMDIVALDDSLTFRFYVPIDSRDDHIKSLQTTLETAGFTPTGESFFRGYVYKKGKMVARYDHGDPVDGVSEVGVTLMMPRGE